MNKLDWTRELITHDHRTVRFLGEIDSERPMVVAIQDQHNRAREFASVATRDGCFGHGQRIVNRPVEITRYVNFYDGPHAYGFDSADEARRCAGPTAIAVAVPVTFTEGCGLDKHERETP